MDTRSAIARSQLHAGNRSEGLCIHGLGNSLRPEWFRPVLCLAVRNGKAVAANVHDLDEAAKVVRADDEVVDVDAGYQGVEKRPEIAGDPQLAGIAWRVAARKGRLQAMAGPDRAEESRKASVRATVEHPFLIVTRDFGFTKTRYRGIAKNHNHLQVLFASANWLMRARAVALMG